MTARPFARRAVAAIAVLVSVAVLAGCGVREDDEPRALSADVIPDDIAEGAPASSVPEEATVPQVIYLVENRADNEETLVPYIAAMPRPDGDRFHSQVIETLLEQQRQDDQPYTTAIPPTTSLIDTRLVAADGDGQDKILEINLNQLQVDNPRLKVAFAQMVFTATNIPGVSGVRFFLNNSPVAVPLDVGESQVGAVVTRADFPQLNPPTTSTTVAPPETVAPDEAQPVDPAAGGLDG